MARPAVRWRRPRRRRGEAEEPGQAAPVGWDPGGQLLHPANFGAQVTLKPLPGMSVPGAIPATGISSWQTPSGATSGTPPPMAGGQMPGGQVPGAGQEGLLLGWQNYQVPGIRTAGVSPRNA